MDVRLAFTYLEVRPTLLSAVSLKTDTSMKGAEKSVLVEHGELLRVLDSLGVLSYILLIDCLMTKVRCVYSIKEGRQPATMGWGFL